MILPLLIFNIAFWLYIASEKEGSSVRSSFGPSNWSRSEEGFEVSMKKYFQGKKLQTASSSLPSYSTTPSPALSLLSSPSTADLFSPGRRRENGKSQKV